MLLDHFATAVESYRPWSSIHAQLSATISEHLNETLPPGYFACPEVRRRHEVDVAVVDDPLAVAATGGSPTAATTLSPTRLGEAAGSSESINVKVLDERGGTKTLVAVIELVSPANKESREGRSLFLGKIEGLIRAGVGVVAVDFVTTSPRSLHRELMLRSGEDDPEADPLSVVSYRLRGDGDRMEIWHRPLHVGVSLPDMAVPLQNGPTMSVPLDELYRDTWRRLRVDFGELRQWLPSDVGGSIQPPPA